VKVALRTDGPRRLWHDRLGACLEKDGHSLVVQRVSPQRSPPVGLGLLLAAERRLYGAESHLFEPVGALASETREADLVLETCFDGAAGEVALLAALLSGRAPRVEIVDAGDSGRLLAAGLPALETPDVLARGLDMVLARTIQLVVQAVRECGACAALPSPAVESGRNPSPSVFLAQTLAGKLSRRLCAPRGHREQWRIGVRRVEGQGTASARAWTSADLAMLPNDGRRFQADPFLFNHAGRTCLFYEDYPYATRKGVIVVVELDGAGRSSAPRCVLEEPWHLSYPQVFAHENAVYMLPEMSASAGIRLFRADPFPDRWVLDRVLVDGIVAGDATIIAHEGTWWLFATQSGDGGSSWDALALFQAPDLFGPWTPHAGNPVLIDAGAARPAGAMWHEGGTLMRVAQDCRGAYGAGLAICRVDRLDARGYAQTVVARLGPPPVPGAERVHTLNRAGALEVIDLCLA